jgi:hypothetical protein
VATSAPKQQAFEKIAGLALIAAAGAALLLANSAH